MQRSRIDESQAKALDKMLRDCDNDNGYFTYSDLKEIDNLIIIANILSNLGYIKIMSNGHNGLLISLLDDGKTFIRSDSFLSQIEEEAEKQKKDERMREIEETKHRLTLSQIKSAKREPYLIVWSVITTITTIILSILLLLK